METLNSNPFSPILTIVLFNVRSVRYVFPIIFQTIFYILHMACAFASTLETLTNLLLRLVTHLSVLSFVFHFTILKIFIILNNYNINIIGFQCLLGFQKFFWKIFRELHGTPIYPIELISNRYLSKRIRKPQLTVYEEDVSTLPYKKGTESIIADRLYPFMRPTAFPLSHLYVLHFI